MHKTIISDTSCFIVLTNIGELDLLQKVYRKITTTIEVADEFDELLPGLKLKKLSIERSRRIKM